MFGGGICFITDTTYTRLSAYEMTAEVLLQGIRFIQYRDKHAARGELYSQALALRELTRTHGAIFIVNDHPDIALSVDADGVHLGQDDLPLSVARKLMGNRIVGISTHDLDQAREAQEGGADYIGFGPVFPTTTKDAGEPKGLEMLRTIVENVSIPVVAIGGIGPDNLDAVLRTGACAAMATAICKGDISANAGAMVRKVRDANIPK